MKSLKPSKNAHTANTKFGSGDYYGTGVKQKTATSLRSYMDAGAVSSKKLGTPPKSLA